MAVKVSDSTGETWLSAFNDEAEKIIGCTADDLNDLKSEVRKLKTYISTGTQSLFSMFWFKIRCYVGFLQEGEVNEFQTKLKEATWSSHLFRISVSQQEYNSEKRQRITVRGVSPIDFAAETRLLLQDISKNKTSQ